MEPSPDRNQCDEQSCALQFPVDVQRDPLFDAKDVRSGIRLSLLNPICRGSDKHKTESRFLNGLGALFKRCISRRSSASRSNPPWDMRIEPTSRHLGNPSSGFLPPRSFQIEELAGATGLEPAASCVTGRRSNQLN